jgi:hypothetical protein
MTAGHNALRGSGPGQNRAFDDAMAQVGCPDRRIDRLCITYCFPRQPSPQVGLFPICKLLVLWQLNKQRSQSLYR